MTTYYKVLKRASVDGERSSLLFGPYSVAYIPDKTTRPHPALPNSRLMVFKTEEDARDFLVHDGEEELWEVDCKDVVPLTYVLRFSRLIWSPAEELNMLWENLDHPSYIQYHTTAAPPGTYGAKNVKLIKELPILNLPPKNEDGS